MSVGQIYPQVITSRAVIPAGGEVVLGWAMNVRILQQTVD